MGTWGDASSTFNYFSKETFLFIYTEMSDSHFFHLVAEQGVLLSIYFYIFYFIIRNSGNPGISLFMFFLGIEMGHDGAIIFCLSKSSCSKPCFDYDA